MCALIEQRPWAVAAAGRNRGVDEGPGDVIVFIDSDLGGDARLPLPPMPTSPGAPLAAESR